MIVPPIDPQLKRVLALPAPDQIGRQATSVMTRCFNVRLPKTVDYNRSSLGVRSSHKKDVWALSFPKIICGRNGDTDSRNDLGANLDPLNHSGRDAGQLINGDRSTRDVGQWDYRVYHRSGITRKQPDAGGSRAIRNGQVQRPAPRLLRRKHRS